MEKKCDVLFVVVVRCLGCVSQLLNTNLHKLLTMIFVKVDSNFGFRFYATSVHTFIGLLICGKGIAYGVCTVLLYLK